MISSNWVTLHQPCPVCPSSDGYCTAGDGHSYCFSCLTYFPGRESFDPLSNEFTYEYLPRRGITKDTFKFYDTKTKIGSDGEPVSVGYVYPNGAIKVRDLKEKGFHWVKNAKGESGVGLFGRDKFTAGSHKFVTITEGEDDAHSLYQVLGAGSKEYGSGPVVSVQSASSAKRDCTVDYDFLCGFERIYLAFDNDAPGREAVRSVASLFDPNKLFVVRFGSRKDANDYLRVGEDRELRNIWWNSRQYLPDNIVSSFSDFEEVLRKEPTKGVPYPFQCLTDMTYGIRTGETVLLTAQEKVGKTSIMKAIEYQILRETKDAVGAFYLEEPAQRHLQGLAGIHLRKPVHLPDCGVGTDDIVSALREVVGETERLYLYSHFGSGDPDDLLGTIRFLVSGRSVRYILLDHIGMAVAGLEGEKDERKKFDYLSTKLEMMVKELDFALIMVAHVNDEGKTRSSRWLTKIADITIQAERDGMALDEQTRNTIRLSVPYNRFCAKSGYAGSLRLNPDTYLLEQVADNDNDIPVFDRAVA